MRTVIDLRYDRAMLCKLALDPLMDFEKIAGLDFSGGHAALIRDDKNFVSSAVQ
ncbi:MAG TPA: hypothetical protein VK788_25240 [Terriglobales bacterium]|nr:hypothetical protein [Terriglobales bacterium]